MKEEWLFSGAMVPVDAATTAALVAEIKRLINVVGGMALSVNEWVGLTDEEILDIVGRAGAGYPAVVPPYTRDLFKKIEDKLREKNGDNAKRYLWLRARPVEDCTTPRIEVNAWTCNVNDDGVSDSINEGNVLAGDALDAAIDKAMLGEKNGG